MDQNKLDKCLIKVIKEAQELMIPVPDNICGNVIINSRPRKRYGCCRVKNDFFQIEISKFVLECSWEKISEILAHEVLHTCEGCYNHGKLWKKYARLMNDAYGYEISRLSSPEKMGLEKTENEDQIRYIIKCKQCGREYPRQRFTCVMQKINAYRCRCGGELILIKLSKEKER